MTDKELWQQQFQFSPLGDQGLVITIDSAELDDWGKMADAASCLRSAGANEAWLVDIVPAYASVTVVYQIARAKRSLGRAGSSESVYQLVRDWAARQLAAREWDSAERGKHLIDIPVCYGGLYGPDLEEAAARSGMAAEQFILRHSSAIYTVALIGFAPGFPYLHGLPPELAQPRKATPRAQVPAGTVAIAGGQAGIYPQATPGGWQVIGRTPLKLFRPQASSPSLLQAGDQVRFVPISTDHWEALEQTLEEKP